MSLLSRIQKLREQNGNISINKLEKEVGLSRGSMSKWDDHSPSPDKLKKIADRFNVSIEYLLGEKEKSPVGKTDEDVEEFDRLFKQLPPEVQARELAYLRELVNGKDK